MLSSAPTLTLLTTAEEDAWRASLPASRNVFGSVELATILEEHKGYRARLVVFTDARTKILYPFLMRPLSALPFERQTTVTQWDTVTPEYTGPLAWGEIEPGALESFRADFARFCRQNGIVSEFAHLHPWQTPSAMTANGHVTLDREVVFIDLTASNEELWAASFSHSCRKNIRRAIQENVRVFETAGPEDIRSFHDIYIRTMRRRSAKSSYHFPLSYFMSLYEQLREHAVFLLAAYQGRTMAATLYLHDDENVYSYLGGADEAFQQVRPTNAIVYEDVQWGRRRGKKRLILGGGYEPGDGIFRFKASFSPLRAPFRVHRQIHLHDRYEALCRAWASHYRSATPPMTYFPAYRSSFD